MGYAFPIPEKKHLSMHLSWCMSVGGTIAWSCAIRILLPATSHGHLHREGEKPSVGEEVESVCFLVRLVGLHELGSSPQKADAYSNRSQPRGRAVW